jgi:catecholate siderophore receptor
LPTRFANSSITFGRAEDAQIETNINLRGFTAHRHRVDGARDRDPYDRGKLFLDSVAVLWGPSSLLFRRGSSKPSLLTPRNEASASLSTNDYHQSHRRLQRSVFRNLRAGDPLPR